MPALQPCSEGSQVPVWEGFPGSHCQTREGSRGFFPLHVEYKKSPIQKQAKKRNEDSEFPHSDLFIFLNITFEMSYFFLAFLGVLLCW